MTESKVSVEAAREALDSLDDYARMGVGVDAHGPRGMLERFISQQAELIEAAKGVLPFVVYQVLEHCDGNKCRDSWCAGCSGEEQAEQSVDEANRASTRLYAALAACTPAKSEEGDGCAYAGRG